MKKDSSKQKTKNEKKKKWINSDLSSYQLGKWYGRLLFQFRSRNGKTLPKTTSIKFSN